VSGQAAGEGVPVAPPPSQGRPPAPDGRPPAQPARRGGPPLIRLVAALTGALLVLVVGALALWLPSRSGSDPKAASAVPVSWQRPVVSASGLAEQSGVQLTRVAISGAGGLVDLRFKVLDPDKAVALHDKATPPALVDEKTGVVVNELLMSHAHHGAYKPGVSYYLVFNNPGDWVHHGSKVTVLLGNAQVAHVVVR
jgi:hypothetical protein